MSALLTSCLGSLGASNLVGATVLVIKLTVSTCPLKVAAE